jgi:hypothetical protein
MSSVSWTATTSGSWTTASNWSGGELPGPADDVTIAVSSITVTLGSGDQEINSLTTAGSTLDVIGGTLGVASGTNLGGLLEQSAGLINIASNSNTFSGGVTLTGGTLAATGNTHLNSTLQQRGGLAEFTGNSNVFTFGVTEAGGILDIGNGVFESTVTESKGTINFLGNDNQLTGTVSQTGGTMAFQSGGQISNFLTQTAGAISVAAGTLALQNTAASLAGTISGAGTLLINSGQFSTSLNSGAVLSIGVIDLASGSLLLNTSETYGGLFDASTNSTIILGSHTLALSGKAVLGAFVSGQGTVTVSGGGALNGLVLDGPSVLDITASINETGNIVVGNSGGSAAQLDIAKGGRLRLTGSDTVYSNSGAGTLSNAGTLVKTAGSNAGTATIYASVINAASATVAVNAGTIDFLGVNQSFSGTLTGGGTVEFGSFNDGNETNTTLTALTLTTADTVLAGEDTLSLDSSLAYSGSWDQTGGTLLLNSNNIVLALSGQDALDGGVIKTATGTITASGPLTVGNGLDIEGFTAVNLSDVVHQSSTISLGVQNGSLPTATIEAGATWYIEDNSSIDGADGKIVNNGTLEKLNGAGDSVLQGTLVNTGTLTVASSTLSMNGVGTLGGLITGKGELDINGTYLLDPGTLTVGEMFIDGQNASITLGANITYGNTWSQQAGTLTVVGETLTLTGDTSLDGGAVVGAGTMTDSGAVVLGGSFSLAQSAVLDITGSAEQVSAITVGLDANSQAELQIAKGVTYTMDDSVNILGSGTLVVAGTLVTGGSGAGQINPAIVDNGVITVSDGSMRFIGAVTGNGAFVIDGGANLDIGSSAAFSNSVSFSGTGGSLFLENPQDFTATIGHFTTGDYIELAGVTLQAGGATLSANGETLTLSASETLTFSSAQSLNSLVIGVGPHNDLAVFHT